MRIKQKKYTARSATNGHKHIGGRMNESEKEDRPEVVRKEGTQSVLNTEELFKKMSSKDTFRIIDVSSKIPRAWSIDRSESIPFALVQKEFKDSKEGEQIVVYSSDDSNADVVKAASLLTAMGLTIFVYNGDANEWAKATHLVAA